MAKTNKDSKYIADDMQEIAHAAMVLGVKKSVVMKAKEDSGSNEREVIYDWIRNCKSK